MKPTRRTIFAISALLTSRAVRFLPERPASGEVLMPTVTEMDGSSTVISGGESPISELPM